MTNAKPRAQISSLSRRTASAALTFAIVLGIIATQAAHAQTFTVLYNFEGNFQGRSPADGVNPNGNGGLIQDPEGNLYGTTQNGGAHEIGTIFKVDQSGNETVLYSFTGGADGGLPLAGLFRDPQGNLFGVNSGGELPGGPCPPCTTPFFGAVFKLDTSNNLTVLHTFQDN